MQAAEGVSGRDSVALQSDSSREEPDSEDWRKRGGGRLFDAQMGFLLETQAQEASPTRQDATFILSLAGHPLLRSDAGARA